MKKNPVFVLAPDSFKGSLTAKEVCQAMENGIKRILPQAVCIQVPMADGGEGTVQSLVDATKGQLITLQVTGPLGDPVTAQYGLLGDGETAVIEMASASGLHLVDEKTKNPLTATTYGTGQLVKDCLNRGIRKIVLGLGGSATNDGGAGFAQALGVRFSDKEGHALPSGGAALSRLHHIDTSGLDKRLKNIWIEIASDVTNPLCGENGASHVFGPQKGATPSMVNILDVALNHYASLLKQHTGKDIASIPGAGAAGGLGAAVLAFTQAELKRGVDIVIEYTHLREAVSQADYVLTGEGGIDFQTLFGKTPYGVARIAKAENKPVIAIAGFIGTDIESLYDTFDAIFGIVPGVMTMAEAMQTASRNVERTVEQIVRLLEKDSGS